ncbi:MAG TPA: hypothetical protein VLU46_02440 [Thermoanaerobaculia bacterium]|nr:hypothetical protein [Thermoanaerobaculia bacterium]
MQLLAALITIAPLVGFQSGAAKTSPAYGLMVSSERSIGRELDVVAIDQQTRTRDDTARVNVLYVQIGGRYVFDPAARLRPYIGGTVGATRADVGGAVHLSPSGALGAGADVQLAKNVALRLDGRVHVTFGGNTTLECSSEGACSGSTSSGFSQFVASAGLAFRF